MKDTLPSRFSAVVARYEGAGAGARGAAPSNVLALRPRAGGLAADELLGVLDLVPAALFVVDAAAGVREQNRAASRLLAAGGLESRVGVLTHADPDLDQRLKSAIWRALKPPRPSALLSLPLEGGAQADVSVAPLDARAGHAAELALVAVVAPAADEAAIGARLRALYKLSPAEARAAGHLAMGRTLEEIAGLLGVKQVTLRTQLRSVFHKTGTARQAELVRLALAGAVGWGTAG